MDNNALLGSIPTEFGNLIELSFLCVRPAPTRLTSPGMWGQLSTRGRLIDGWVSGSTGGAGRRAGGCLARSVGLRLRMGDALTCERCEQYNNRYVFNNPLNGTKMPFGVFGCEYFIDRTSIECPSSECPAAQGTTYCPASSAGPLAIRG